MKQLAKLFLLMVSAASLIGCATPEHNVKLSESFWQNPQHKIVISKTKVEHKAMMYATASGYRHRGLGLLGMAISAAATQEFNKYLKKTSLDWYHELPQKFATQFKQRHISAQIYAADIHPKQKDKVAVVVQLAGDKILLLELQKLGAIRSYYSFIPTGAPKAYCVLKGELIDRQDKKVLWRHLAKIEETVHGDWDQPPSYPNFTVALQQAIDAAQEEVIDSFFSGH